MPLHSRSVAPPPERARRDGLAGRLVHGEEVEPVDVMPGRPKPSARLATSTPDWWYLAERRLGVAVVLDHEDDGQVPRRGEVQALQERALVGAAVAGEGDRDLVGVPDLGGQADAADQRRAAADDAVGAEHPFRQVGDVHRAALAVAEAVALAVDLGHHALDVAALGDRVAVAAMRAGDVVVGAEVGADAGRDRLLARVEMHEARDLAGGELGVQALLELADRAHHAVGLEQLVLGELARCWWCDSRHGLSSCGWRRMRR